MKTYNNIILVLLLVFSSLTFAEEIQLNREAYPSIVKIRKKDNKGFAGTAFFISPDFLVTNFHVISDFKGSIDDIFFIETVDLENIPIEFVMALDGINDLTVLKVKAYQSKDYYNIQPNNKKLKKRNQRIKTAGFPKGKFKYTEGHIQKQIHDNTYFYLEEFMDKGASGSPVFFDSGELAGIISRGDFTNKYSFIMTPFKKIEALLYKNPLYCRSSDCIKEELGRVEELAQKGNRKAQFMLGNMYYQAIGMKQDYSLALKWFKAAAFHGHIEAQYALGAMYYFGIGVERDYQLALKWFKESARKGYPKAKYKLGFMYYEGHGVQQNYKLALKWFKGLALQGDFKAQYNLGVMYYFGRGVEQNYKLALKWFKKAADRDHFEAQNALGVMYQNGIGVRQNESLGLKWFKKLNCKTIFKQQGSF